MPTTAPTPPLRHGLAAVPVHLIAEQRYCERKVDLSLGFPTVERPTAEVEAGAAGHEALAASGEPIGPADLEGLLAAGERVRLHEYGFRGEVDGVPVVGRPDVVFLDGRTAELVLEFKFSAWRRPFPSHRLQLLAYGHLVGLNGYDVSRLVCGVLMLPPPTPGAPPGERQTVLAEPDYDVCAAHASHLAARRAATPARVVAFPHAVGGGSLWLFPYDPAEAARGLGWALAFWKGLRLAALADNPSKCRRCAFLEAKLCGGTRTR